MKKAIKNSMTLAKALYLEKSCPNGIPTGFVDLDAAIGGGLSDGNLVVIASLPSMGKSALAQCIADYVGVEKRLPVAIFNPETTKENLAQGFLCSQTNIDLVRLRVGFLTPKELSLLTSAANRLSQAPIFLDDCTLNICKLRAKAWRLKIRHNIKLLIVDHLQILEPLRKREKRQQEISDILYTLKILAIELDICIIVLSQLSNASDDHTGHKPQIAELEETEVSTQKADVVI